MPDIETARLILHPVDAAEARRIRHREPAPEDRWSDDYPFEGDIAALNGFLAATERDGEQQPFGYYRITRRRDGRAVGGIGFKGQPKDGAVEVGYGLAASARGHGYAAEALTALATAAAHLGVGAVRADTAPDNAASRGTLERAGFVRTAADTDLLHYELSVGSTPVNT
jgi:RimJ/RimL family protein N-acetyltransferase